MGFTRPWSRRYETNILKLWQSAAEEDHCEGMLWYARANRRAQELSERFGIELWQSAGVIAALSPGCEWGRNLIDASRLMEAFVSGKRGRDLPIVGAYGWANIEKAERILKGENPLIVMPETAKKTRNFFGNILFPESPASITIDRHAKAVAENLPPSRKGYASEEALATVRLNEYEYIAWHYRRISERLGILPNQLQAVLWCAWKHHAADERVESDQDEKETKQ